MDKNTQNQQHLEEQEQAKNEFLKIYLKMVKQSRVAARRVAKWLEKNTLNNKDG